jgi:4-amino-4-deoxychorismate lyase
MNMLLIDGQSLSSIPVDDRSFQYGDGCFSTILTVDGQLQHWKYHRERMERCLNTLLISHPDWAEVEQWIKKVVLPDARAGVKIHISRGSGGRGYSPKNVNVPRVTIQSFAYPAHYHELSTKGIRLSLCQRRLGINPLLAGHKHNNRLEQVLLKAEVEQYGYLDGVALDVNDHVIETTMANLFWFRDNVLYSPDLTQAGVAGVMRRVVLELAQQQGISVTIGDFSLEHLLSAKEIFMTNSILGVAPVVEVQSAIFLPGEKTRYFQKRVNEC